MHLLHSQRTDGGDKAGLVGLSLTERKAPTRTAHEIRAGSPGCQAGPPRRATGTAGISECQSVDGSAWGVIGSVSGVVGAAAAIIFRPIPLLRERHQPKKVPST